MIDLRLTVRPQDSGYVWRLTVNGVLVQVTTRAKRRPLPALRRN